MKTPFALLTLSALLLLTGCGLSTVGMKTMVSGGKEVTFMFGERGPERAKDDRALIMASALAPAKDPKQLIFSFAVAKSATAPRMKSVKVENVSEPTPELLVSDSAPQLTQHGLWRGKSRDYALDDPSLYWLKFEGNSFRVYLVTVEWEDGKKSELYQLEMVPSFLKELIRKEPIKDAKPAAAKPAAE